MVARGEGRSSLQTRKRVRPQGSGYPPHPEGDRKGQYISLKDLLQEVQVQGDRADRQNRGTDPQD